MTTVPDLRGALPLAAPPTTPTTPTTPAPWLTPGGLVELLASYGDRPALLGRDLPGGQLSYAALADRVAEAAAAFGTARLLVLLEGGRDLDSLVAHLGAMAAEQVVLLAGAAAMPALRAAWDPDVVLDRAAVGDLSASLAQARAARPASAHDLHPALALLLSTSGSTGSPKLVRLSRTNVVSNARAIADYLDVRPGDVAPTALPVEYCYGLSVVHSHLLAGAALLLTEDSVTDRRFWDDARRHRVTSVAGVPHTYDLLERAGLVDRVRDLGTRAGGSLRTLTQAGGRMAPEAVRRWARLGEEAGVDLVVMYGQTEATARMAWLPPALAATAPGAIGRPVAASSFRVDPVPAEEREGLPEGTGELVFRGPGVMLGYATAPADLARGRDVVELRTGDLGRQRPDGLWEVVGRRARFAKVLGLRVDLDRCERLLAAEGVVALAVDGGHRVVLGVCDGARPVDVTAVRATATRLLGLPPAAVAVVTYPEVPRLPQGKVDRRAVARLAEVQDRSADGSVEPLAAGALGRDPAAAVAQVYAAALGRPEGTVAPADSFVGLGGDSLTYVEVSLRLEALLGRVPADWPTRTVADLADLAARAGGRRRWPHWRRLETGVLLRAVAIVTVVGTHANLWTLLGGAHVLLAVAGANLARFGLVDDTARARARRVVRGAARVAVPAALVIGTVSLWTPGLGWQQALLVNSLVEQRWSEPGWHYWFIEALVLSLLAVAALVALPPVHRLERRFPFALPLVLALLALVARAELVPATGDQIHRAQTVVWLFLLGWAGARARTTGHRLLLSAVVAASVPGFFDDGARDAYVLLGLLALVWVPAVRVPDLVARLAVPLAAASLWTYLVHWQVYPHLEHEVPWAATLLSLLAGHLAWRGSTVATARLRARSGAGVVRSRE